MKKSELKKIIREEINQNSIADKVWGFEQEISGEWSEEYQDDIMKLKTAEDVVNYYMIDREWSNDMNLASELLGFFANIIDGKNW